MSTSITPTQIRHIHRLRRAGYGVCQIARVLGIRHQRVSEIVRQPAPRRGFDFDATLKAVCLLILAASIATTLATGAEIYAPGLVAALRGMVP